jgi:hypothetical protein
MCLVPRISKIRTKDVRSSLKDQDVRRRRAKDQRCPPKDEDLKRRVSKTKDVKDNSVVLLMPVTAKDKLAGTQKHVWYKITWRQSLYFYHIFIYLSFSMLAAWSPAVGCQIEGLIWQSGQSATFYAL